MNDMQIKLQNNYDLNAFSMMDNPVWLKGILCPLLFWQGPQRFVLCTVPWASDGLS